jgi:Restriction endonuclease PvuII
MPEPEELPRPPERPKHYLKPAGDIEPLIEMGVALQAKATDHNIHNVFDDGGYKELMLLTLFELRKLNREGDDAVDAEGRRYEIKTVARVSSRGSKKSQLQVTTEHTMTLANLERYRKTFLWIVAVFDQARPEAIYEITPDHLEPFFARWEGQLRATNERGDLRIDHINNPKIPLTFIAANGVRVWPPEPGVDLPPAAAEGLQQLLTLKPNLEPPPTEK